MKTDNTPVDVDTVARIVHNAQRDFGLWLDDSYPPDPYDALSEEARLPAQSLVRLIAQGYSTDYVHDIWVTSMEEKGWKYGDVKDPYGKTHPCMTLFKDLSQWEKRRLNLAYDIVEGFTRYMDLS